MSLLTIVQDAADRLGVVRPSSVIGSSDQQVRQLLALANQEGKELARRYNWNSITREHAFTVGESSNTVTMTIASPCVVSLTNHGFSAGDEIYFTTTGTLPTGLAPATVYYVISSGLATNSFEISLTPGGSAVNTTGTQSGTHTCIQTEYNPTTTPTDFDRLLPETFFNRTKRRFVQGPLNSVEWQEQAAFTTTILFDAFRIRNNTILLAPTPANGDIYAFEYVSKYWCTSVSGTSPTQASWSVDTDIGILSEELMTLGLIWRFKKAKGLDYAEEFRTYEAQVMIRQANDGGKRSVNFAKPRNPNWQPRPRWPDSSWNLT